MYLKLNLAIILMRFGELRDEMDDVNPATVTAVWLQFSKKETYLSNSLDFGILGSNLQIPRLNITSGQ